MRKFWRVLEAYIGTIIVPLIACLALVFTLITNSRITSNLDNEIYDIFISLNADGKHSDLPIIIDIDEKSLETFGQWPWPRYILSRLLLNLSQNGVLAIGLDILFSEKDRSSPALVSAELKERFGIDFNVSILPKELRDNDENFAFMLKNTPVVLGAFAFFDENSRIPDDLPKATSIAQKIAPNAPSPELPSASGILLPLKEFYQSAPIGLVNTKYSSDGITRSVPLIVKVGDKLYANLALRTLMMAINKKTLRMDADIDGISGILVGKLKVGVNSDGSFNPLFSGKQRTYEYISAKDILESRIPPERLKGKIAFVGSSASGLLDIRNTPIDSVMPGVEVHANIVDNILNGKSIITPKWSIGAQVLAVILLYIFSTFLFKYAPTRLYLALTLSILVGIFFASLSMFERGIFISPMPSMLSLIIYATIILSFRFYQEEKSKIQLKSAFSRYLAPELVAQIANSNENFFAGKQKSLSILFTDIREFTSISERLEPQKMVELLDFYFSPMTQCVKQNSGTMDKFIGDALMAFWNAPLDIKDHATKAVLTAMQMQDKLKELKDEILTKFGVEIHIGAGINTGMVHVGNMGTKELLNYTCIGDEVNLASRLEGMCKYYGVGIVVSENCAKECKNLEFRKLDKIRVKGKKTAISIFTPICNDEKEMAIKWESALALYAKGDFKAGILEFTKIANEHSEYKFGANVFISRSKALLASPPANWDGVWNFETK